MPDIIKSAGVVAVTAEPDCRGLRRGDGGDEMGTLVTSDEAGLDAAERLEGSAHRRSLSFDGTSFVASLGASGASLLDGSTIFEAPELFEKITTLPEHYLARPEREILTGAVREIGTLAGKERAVVEFGSGSSANTSRK